MGFLAALHFLTIIPAPLPPVLPDDAWGRSMAYFPLVGFVLGACLLVSNSLLLHVWPPTVVAACVLGLWVVLTGALHLDGIADCCDGLLVAKTPDERLRILRDTHAGTFAVVGVVILLLIKYACLVALEIHPGTMNVSLVLAPVLSRWAMVYATVVYPYGRKGHGLGQTFSSHVTRRSLWVSSLMALVLGGLVGGWFGLAALALVWVLTCGVARWAMTRIPGLTGDVYGAINELCETAVLLFAVAVVH